MTLFHKTLTSAPLKVSVLSPIICIQDKDSYTSTVKNYQNHKMFPGKIPLSTIRCNDRENYIFPWNSNRLLDGASSHSGITWSKGDEFYS